MVARRSVSACGRIEKRGSVPGFGACSFKVDVCVRNAVTGHTAVRPYGPKKVRADDASKWAAGPRTGALWRGPMPTNDSRRNPLRSELVEKLENLDDPLDATCGCSGFCRRCGLGPSYQAHQINRPRVSHHLDVVCADVVITH